MDINAQVHSLYILRRVPQRRNHTMKTNTPIKFIQPAGPDRLIKPRGIAVLVNALGLAFLLSTGGFQIYWSKERRLIVAGDEIVTALKAYRNASPGTAKGFPLELADLAHDPHLLADNSYLLNLPVDPITQTKEWGVRSLCQAPLLA